MFVFHCGVLSPVSTASSAMQLPASSRQSAGTTFSDTGPLEEASARGSKEGGGWSWKIGLLATLPGA